MMRRIRLAIRSTTLAVLFIVLALAPAACQDLTPETTTTTTTEQPTTTTSSTESTTTTVAKVYMPGLVGLSEGEAKTQLEALHIEYAVRAVPTTNSSKLGKVTAQDVAEGTEITPETTVKISVGRTGVEVPTVTGLPDYDAAGWLESLGFEVSITYDPPPDPANPALYVVRTQNPGGESIALEGSTVKLTCGREF